MPAGLTDLWAPFIYCGQNFNCFRPFVVGYGEVQSGFIFRNSRVKELFCESIATFTCNQVDCLSTGPCPAYLAENFVVRPGQGAVVDVSLRKETRMGELPYLVTVPDGKTPPWPRRKGEGVQITKDGLITNYLRFQ